MRIRRFPNRAGDCLEREPTPPRQIPTSHPCRVPHQNHFEFHHPVRVESRSHDRFEFHHPVRVESRSHDRFEFQRLRYPVPAHYPRQVPPNFKNQQEESATIFHSPSILLKIIINVPFLSPASRVKKYWPIT